MMSAFAEWFAAQHGNRSRTSHSDDQLKDQIETGESAKSELERRKRWDDLRNSALYAWQIKDKDKK